ncbi:class F sortase [Herbiconiux daphne]|uniref:class F sortase n=1 Tax=Herbiconiux daphne TaxID=2970914 RepID=UPI002877E057|nr:class F sortase [Herbiconiux daphne]
MTLLAGCSAGSAGSLEGAASGSSPAAASGSADRSDRAGSADDTATPGPGGMQADASSGAAGAMQDPQLAPGLASAADSATATDAAAGEARSAAQPVRVRIPSIGVDSGLESLTRDATGAIEAPADFASAGWYRDGVVPGDLGPAVIAGHIDSAVGPAVFSALASLTPGARVEVDLSDGRSVAFTVDRSIQAPKNAFPTTEVYGPTPDAQLRLVTCGGVFDDSTGHYLDNVVVFATYSS